MYNFIVYNEIIDELLPVLGLHVINVRCMQQMCMHVVKLGIVVAVSG